VTWADPLRLPGRSALLILIFLALHHDGAATSDLSTTDLLAIPRTRYRTVDTDRGAPAGDTAASRSGNDGLECGKVQVTMVTGLVDARASAGTVRRLLGHAWSRCQPDCVTEKVTHPSEYVIYVTNSRDGPPECALDSFLWARSVFFGISSTTMRFEHVRG
jgi:hypothetical protein